MLQMIFIHIIKHATDDDQRNSARHDDPQAHPYRFVRRPDLVDE